MHCATSKEVLLSSQNGVRMITLVYGQPRVHQLCTPGSVQFSTARRRKRMFTSSGHTSWQKGGQGDSHKNCARRCLEWVFFGRSSQQNPSFRNNPTGARSHWIIFPRLQLSCVTPSTTRCCLPTSTRSSKGIRFFGWANVGRSVRWPRQQEHSSQS